MMKCYVFIPLLFEEVALVFSRLFHIATHVTVLSLFHFPIFILFKLMLNKIPQIHNDVKKKGDPAAQKM